MLYLVDVDGIGLFPLALPLLLVALGDSLGGFAGLGGGFPRSLGWHDDTSDLKSARKPSDQRNTANRMDKSS